MISDCKPFDINALPTELLALTLSFLDAEDLARSSGVNREWNSLAGRAELWEAACRRKQWGLLRDNSAVQRQSLWEKSYVFRDDVQKRWKSAEFDALLFEAATSVLCVHQHERFAVCGSRDGRICVYDVDSGVPLHVLIGHTDWVRAVTVLRHSSRVLSASSDGSLRVWDLHSSAHDWVTQLHSHTEAVSSVGQHENLVVSASLDCTLRVWDLRTPARPTQILPAHPGGVCDVHVDAAAPLVVSCGGGLGGARGALVSVWDRRMWRPLHSFAAVPAGGVAEPCRMVVVKSSVVVCALYSATPHVFDMSSGRHMHELPCCSDYVFAMCTTSHDKLITASQDGVVKLWDAAAGTLQHSLRTPYALATNALHSRDESSFIIGTDSAALSIRLHHPDLQSSSFFAP